MGGNDHAGADDGALRQGTGGRHPGKGMHQDGERNAQGGNLVGEPPAVGGGEGADGPMAAGQPGHFIYPEDGQAFQGLSTAPGIFILDEGGDPKVRDLCD